MSNPVLLNSPELTQALADALHWKIQYHGSSRALFYHSAHRYCGMPRREFELLLELLIQQRRVRFEQQQAVVIIHACQVPENGG